MEHIVDITEYLRLLMKSSHFHVLLVQGPPGWGKTSLVRSALGDLGQPYQLLGAYATPLALFNALAADPAGILVIDDTAGLFQNQQAMAVLNAATWAGADGSGGRRVLWSSTAERARADVIDYQGKIIVLTNALVDSPQVQAFRNRSLYYCLDIDRERIGDLLVTAANDSAHFSDNDTAERVAKFLGERAAVSGPGDISLRTLRLGYELALSSPDRWRELLIKALPNTTLEQLTLELAKSDRPVLEQAAEFQSRTGLGRRKFFYLRERLGLSAPRRPRPQTKSVAPSAAEGETLGLVES